MGGEDKVHKFMTNYTPLEDDDINGSSDENEPLDQDVPLTDEGDPWQGTEVRPRRQEDEPLNASLNVDDAGADADLPRPSRLERQRVRRRVQLSTVVPALLLIAIGVVALARPDFVTTDLIINLLLVALLIGLMMRFLFNARRERGLFFIGVTVLLLGVFWALVLSNTFDVTQGWPLVLVAPGLAMIITFLIERSHERGLVLPGLMLMVAGGALLTFTMGLFDISVLTNIAVYWPILFLLLALALLPRAIRDRGN